MVERHEAPTIIASIFARVGSANETTGITGISHLFEHMMFKGTETIGTKDITRDREIMAKLDALKAKLREEERIMRDRLRRGAHCIKRIKRLRIVEFEIFLPILRTTAIDEPPKNS